LAGGYHYARVKLLTDDSRYRDVPVKDMFSHVAEAAEYGLMDAGEHSIVNAGPSERPAPQRAVMPRASWSPFDA
jgi:hypothetical protein